MKLARTVIALLLIAIAVAASQTAMAQPAAIHWRTMTVPGGSYTNVGPSTLKEMLVQKNFFLLNVHVPYEGEIEGTDANVPYDRIEKGMVGFRLIGMLPSSCIAGAGG